MFVSIKKRNGSIVPFRPDKITTAIARAGKATAEFDEEASGRLTLRVLNLAQQALPGSIPSVEQIQDIVEEVLISSQFRATAKAYIIYREQHARIREIVSRADVDLIDQYLDRCGLARPTLLHELLTAAGAVLRRHIRGPRPTRRASNEIHGRNGRAPFRR